MTVPFPAPKIASSGTEYGKSGSRAIAPEPAMLVRAMRHIGYTFEQALADLVDNSISAGSTEVLIRFVVDEESIRSIAVVDNGVGMTPERLDHAMRFGSETDLTRRTLGKYGMGMKLASLSHAQVLTVVSVQGASASGRRWSLAGIARDWSCDELSEAGAIELAAAPWGPVDLTRRGTLVLWDEIDRLPVGTRGLRDTMRSLQRRLQVHLGMTFHRFLEGEAAGPSVNLTLDLQFAGQSESPHRVQIRPLNPFGYEQTGHPDYPKTFKVALSPEAALDLVAFIWPPNSTSESYRLGNRSAARQGFYFYRNDRLIQAGGWNGLLQTDAEPHGSLARVRIDLPEQLDGSFGLNVQKSAVIVPTTFVPALLNSRAYDGTGIDDFRRDAQTVYRTRSSSSPKDRPAVPGRGLPVSIRRLLTESIEDSEPTRQIGFAWANLQDRKAVFSIDQDSDQILLNERLRVELGNPSGADELRLLKTCLFLLLQEDLNRERMSAPRKQRLELINRALAKALSM